MTRDEIEKLWSESDGAETPMIDFVVQQINRAFDEAAKAVPHTWLDPLLSGPDKVISEVINPAPDIERLSRAVRDRILSLKVA